MNKLSALGSGAIASLSLLANPVAADGSAPQPQLEGAWRLETTVRLDAPDCSTAAIVGVGLNPFQAINTFHRGGTMSEFGTRSPPAARGPGHGVWKRTGERSFKYHSEFFTFDANGFPTGTIEFRTRVRLSTGGDTFRGVARILGTDLSGNELRFCATMTGTRIAL